MLPRRRRRRARWACCRRRASAGSTLPALPDVALANVPALAVSLEQAGGSTDRRAAGPGALHGHGSRSSTDPQAARATGEKKAGRLASARPGDCVRAAVRLRGAVASPAGTGFALCARLGLARLPTTWIVPGRIATSIGLRVAAVDAPARRPRSARDSAAGPITASPSVARAAITAAAPNTGFTGGPASQGGIASSS